MTKLVNISIDDVSHEDRISNAKKGWVTRRRNAEVKKNEGSLAGEQ